MIYPADPFEKVWHESEMYLRWMAENMWLFVPVQSVIKDFITSIDDYPFQPGTSLNAAGINYNTLRAASVLERIEKMEGFARLGN